jgi:hypothetical protein
LNEFELLWLIDRIYEGAVSGLGGGVALRALAEAFRSGTANHRHRRRAYRKGWANTYFSIIHTLSRADRARHDWQPTISLIES